MTDIRTCLQRLVDIWDEPSRRHEMPEAMWAAKQMLQVPPPILPDCGKAQCRHPLCLVRKGDDNICVDALRA